ncbi:LamG domain-containing protein, partial [Candidatus Latescibacterota bacterium]
MLNISSGRFSVIIANGIYDERIYAYTESNTVNDGEWHHLAVSMDRDGEMTIYLDGESAGTKDIASYATINMQAIQEFYIGRRNQASLPNFFNGTIDELRVYDRVLLMAEVQDFWQLAQPLTP